MHIEFYGATSGITGSCHIVRTNDQVILLDCGLIQGGRKAEEKNREPFPFSPDDISAVVLSHGHIDHSGRIPLLIKQGYRGPIYAQNATRDLCKVLLQDSASLQERDAFYENKYRKRKNKELVEPLYTLKDANKALGNFVGFRYNQKHEILPGVTLRYQDAGHIMGSASVELWLEEGGRQSKLVFSGDLGQYDSPILNDPAVIEEADHLIIESTYGNRKHRHRQQTIDELGDIISAARHDKGNILIPAFAVGRTQEILYYLGKHFHEWELDRWQVFLDSPMAIKASKVYWDYPHLYDEETTRLRRKVNEMPELRNLHLTSDVKDSMALNQVSSGAIIIAGSGMCNAGRIVHHLKNNIASRSTHVVIVGYQANGTLGRRMVDGSKLIKIHGEQYPLRARVHTLGGLSAHADEDDLLRWAGSFRSRPKVHVVHGEEESKQALREQLARRLDTHADVPFPGQCVDL